MDPPDCIAADVVVVAHGGGDLSLLHLNGDLEQ
jgi:hypothetical protein